MHLPSHRSGDDINCQNSLRAGLFMRKRAPKLSLGVSQQNTAYTALWAHCVRTPEQIHTSISPICLSKFAEFAQHSLILRVDFSALDRKEQHESVTKAANVPTPKW